MTYDFSQDNNFRAISQDVSLNDGMLKHAWVLYKGEKWYPVIVKDQQSGIRGFEVNFSGKWGKNESVGRKKLGLDELLTNGAWDLLETARSARAANAMLAARFPDDLDCAREMLATRLNRFTLESEVALAIRGALNDAPDSVDDDWMAPLRFALLSFWEYTFRTTLGLPQIVNPLDAVRCSMLVKLVQSGIPNPIKEWRETAGSLAVLPSH